MRGVPLLLRLAQHDLEERRSDLGCISRARTDTETAIDAINETISAETSIAMTDPVGMAVFSAWMSQSTRSRARLRDRFQELNKSADAARENLRDTAAQVKRLEIVLDTARSNERRASAKQADVMADELEAVRWAEFISQR
jgi:flagellar export protein FliJ